MKKRKRMLYDEITNCSSSESIPRSDLDISSHIRHTVEYLRVKYPKCQIETDIPFESKPEEVHFGDINIIVDFKKYINLSQVLPAAVCCHPRIPAEMKVRYLCIEVASYFAEIGAVHENASMYLMKMNEWLAGSRISQSTNAIVNKAKTDAKTAFLYMFNHFDSVAIHSYMYQSIACPDKQYDPLRLVNESTSMMLRGRPLYVCNVTGFTLKLETVYYKTDILLRTSIAEQRKAEATHRANMKRIAELEKQLAKQQKQQENRMQSKQSKQSKKTLVNVGRIKSKCNRACR